MDQNPVPPVNIPIPTKIGSEMGGAPTNQNGIPLALTQYTHRASSSGVDSLPGAPNRRLQPLRNGRGVDARLRQLRDPGGHLRASGRFLVFTPSARAPPHPPDPEGKKERRKNRRKGQRRKKSRWGAKRGKIGGSHRLKTPPKYSWVKVDRRVGSIIFLHERAVPSTLTPCPVP